MLFDSYIYCVDIFFALLMKLNANLLNYFKLF